MRLILIFSLLLIFQCSHLRVQDKLGYLKYSKNYSNYESIPIEINPLVNKWVNYYQTRGKKHMIRYLSRSYRYLPMMQKILKEHGLPEDLIFVPFIESGFSHSAHSHASAVGYWQFIKGTAIRYGLKVDDYIDERRDPILSTQAAALYLKNLYGMFGNWYLALAAYNTGENRVKRIVKKYKTENFWKLVKRRKFFRETSNYIPKFQAARLIFKNKEIYGFRDIDFDKPIQYEKIKLKHSISLLKLAKKLSIKYKDLKYLNPRYTSDFVPVKKTPVEIKVPEDYKRRALAVLKDCHSLKPIIQEKYHIWYVVRPGDSLYKIARRFKTSVRSIKRSNALKRNLIRPNQKLKISKRSKSFHRKSAKRDPSFHSVKKGESLSLIAKKYKTSVQKLKKVNRLKNTSSIYVGQKIFLKKSFVKKNFAKNKSIKYRVRKNDSLYSIAQKYKTTVSQIKKKNTHLKKFIHPGQVIRIPASKSR